MQKGSVHFFFNFCLIRLFKIFNLFPTRNLWQPEGKPVPVAKCSSCRVTGPIVSRVSLEAAEGSPRAEEGSRWSGGERHRGARERGSEESALLIEVCLLVEGQPCSAEARVSVWDSLPALSSMDG